MAASTPSTKSTEALSGQLATMAESKGILAACDQCFAVLIEVIDQCHAEMPTVWAAASAPTAAKVNDIAQALSHETTKFVLFMSKSEGKGPDLDVLAPSTEALVTQVTHLSCLLRSFLTIAGVTMKKQVVAVGQKVLTDIKRVINQLRAMVAKGQPITPKEIGLVWESLKALTTMCVTNSAAVGRELVTKLSLMADAKEELSALKLDDGSREAKDEDEKDGDDDEDFDDDNDDDVLLSAKEFVIVKPCLELCTMAHGSVRKVYTYILKCKFDDADDKEVAWLEAQLRDSQAITVAMDSLGSALYSPQSVVAGGIAIRTLMTATSSLLARLESHAQFATIFPLTVPAAKTTETKTDAPATTPAIAVAVAPSTTAVACTICGHIASATTTTSSDTRDGTLWCAAVRNKLHAIHNHVAVAPWLR